MTRYLFDNDGGDGVFGNAANWSPGGGPPGIADTARFGSLNAAVHGDGTVGRLLVVGATAISFDGSLSVAGLDRGASMLLDSNAQVAFQQGSALSVAGTLSVQTASALVFAGSTLATDTTLIGADGVSARIGVTDGVWNSAGNVVVGTGQLGIGAGAFLAMADRPGPTAARLIVGQQVGTVGVVAISDGGELFSHGLIQLGGPPGAASHGIGELTVSTGGDVYTTGTLQAGAGSVISLAAGYVTTGVVELAKGASVTGSGAFGATGDLHNDGRITAHGSLELRGDISGTGTLQIATDSTLALPADVTQGAIRFIGGGGTLSLGQNAGTPAMPIGGFAHSDRIDVDFATSVSFDAATDLLTLYTLNQVEGQLQLTGDYAGAVFHDQYANSVGSISVSFDHSNH